MGLPEELSPPMLSVADADLDVFGDSVGVVVCCAFGSNVAANDLVACRADEIKAQSGLNNLGG